MANEEKARSSTVRSSAFRRFNAAQSRQPRLKAELQTTHSHNARGGSTIEYLMVLACVVIPLALLTPLILGMIEIYAGRIATMIQLPFG